MKTPILTYEKLILKLRNPFRLSYGTTEERTVFWIRLAEDAGWGESAIPPYYGVEQDAMITLWERKIAEANPFPDEIQDIPAWVGKDGPAPARCALDIALYDRIARRQGVPLYQLLELPKPEPRVSSFTIAIDTPEEMARMAKEISNYPIIKIKLGSEDDEIRLRAIRKVRPDAKLRVDANAGWSREQAVSIIKKLEVFDLEMIEQPLAKDDIEGMGLVQKQTSIPIVADESVQSLADVEKLAAAGVAGINLKLMKLGGLTTAVKAFKRARELGMRIMLGSMIETSIGVTAMAHLAAQAEWLDLDASNLISNDPFDGIIFDEHAIVSIPDRPGSGVILREKNNAELPRV